MSVSLCQRPDTAPLFGNPDVKLGYAARVLLVVSAVSPLQPRVPGKVGPICLGNWGPLGWGLRAENARRWRSIDRVGCLQQQQMPPISRSVGLWPRPKSARRYAVLQENVVAAQQARQKFCHRDGAQCRAQAQSRGRWKQSL